MQKHKSRAWWLIGLGAFLLLLGVWLTTMTVKRHQRQRAGHSGSWFGLVKHVKQ